MGCNTSAERDPIVFQKSKIASVDIGTYKGAPCCTIKWTCQGKSYQASAKVSSVGQKLVSDLERTTNREVHWKKHFEKTREGDPTVYVKSCYVVLLEGRVRLPFLDVLQGRSLTQVLLQKNSPLGKWWRFQ